MARSITSTPCGRGDNDRAGVDFGLPLPPCYTHGTRRKIAAQEGKGHAMASGSPLVIGLDAGTSAIKAVAFELDGREVALAHRRNQWQAGADGAATQEMRRTFADVCAVLQELVATVPNLADRVIALGVTGQGDGCWLIDAGGEPVGDGLLWLDTRAAGLVAKHLAHTDDRPRFAATGTGLTACQQGPQLAWLAAREPERVARAATAFHCKDYLYFRLTDRRVTDPCETAFSFGNFRTRAYDDTVIEALGLTALRHLLPPIVDGTVETDRLSDAAAAATGLKAGTPVALGYLDAACTALGAGVYAGGQGYGCTILGSTGVHLRATAADAVILPPEPTGYVLVLPVPGYVALMQTNMAATLNLDWVLDLAREAARDLGAPDPDPLARLEEWLTRGRATGLLYHPFISAAGERGPFVNPAARAAFMGLERGHGIADLARAVGESLGHAARHCYEAMGGVPPEVRVTGGAARSPALRRLLSERLGVPVRQSLREEAGAAGVAMIAAVAVGAFPDMDACLSTWVAPKLGPAEAPNAAAITKADTSHAAYLASVAAVTPVWDALSDWRAAERS